MHVVCFEFVGFPVLFDLRLMTIQSMSFSELHRCRSCSTWRSIQLLCKLRANCVHL